MVDQRTKFARLGNSADFVGEFRADKEVAVRVLKGQVQLAFISPENLISNPRFRNMLLSQI
jgi:hypothetical protein